MSFFNKNKSTQIFISYRREGGEALARLIHDRLRQKNYRVFLDVESLRSGMFNIALYKKIEECEDFLIVLPENALDRCIDPDDWVRLEIEHALKLNKNIIPIMMRNFKFPETLPDSLKDLPKYNGVGASMELFDAVMGKLTGMLISKPDIAPFDIAKKYLIWFIAVLAIISITFTLPSLVNKSSSNPPTDEDILKAIEKVDKAMELYVEGNYNGAIKLYSEAIELNPNDYKAHNGRGEAYQKLEKYKLAIDDYDKAIQLNPKFEVAYYHRGIAYSEGLKRYERAIIDYNEAIQLSSKFWQAYNNRGWAYYKLKQYERAIQDFDKTIELYPIFVKKNNNRGSYPMYANAYYNRGLAYQELKQYEQALKDYDKALELDPNFELAKNNRELCLKRGASKYTKLEVIMGVSTILAAVIFSEIDGDIKKFSSVPNLVSYEEFCPKSCQSGENKMDGHMSKYGSPYLRVATFSLPLLPPLSKLLL